MIDVVIVNSHLVSAKFQRSSILLYFISVKFGILLSNTLLTSEYYKRTSIRVVNNKLGFIYFIFLYLFFNLFFGFIFYFRLR